MPNALIIEQWSKFYSGVYSMRLNTYKRTQITANYSNLCAEDGVWVIKTKTFTFWKTFSTLRAKSLPLN